MNNIRNIVAQIDAFVKVGNREEARSRDKVLRIFIKMYLMGLERSGDELIYDTFRAYIVLPEDLIYDKWIIEFDKIRRLNLIDKNNFLLIFLAIVIAVLLFLFMNPIWLLGAIIILVKLYKRGSTFAWPMKLAYIAGSFGSLLLI